MVRTVLRELHASRSADDTRAFANLQVAFGASCVCGPSLGGITYGCVPFLAAWAPPFLLSAAFFVCAFAAALQFEETLERNVAVDGPTKKRGGMWRDVGFLTRLLMAGCHSYIFSGWELAYPLLAKLSISDGGEAWTTSQIGITFLVGSVGLMIWCNFLYERLKLRLGVELLWVSSWAVPTLLLAGFQPVLEWLISSGSAHYSVVVLCWNYGAQIVISALIGSGFVSVQLMMNAFIASGPDAGQRLPLANSFMAASQSIFRMICPLITGALFEASPGYAFYHLALLAIVGCALPAVFLLRSGKSGGSPDLITEPVSPSFADCSMYRSPTFFVTPRKNSDDPFGVDLNAPFLASSVRSGRSVRSVR
jgi:hypothetical protein